MHDKCTLLLLLLNALKSIQCSLFEGSNCLGIQSVLHNRFFKICDQQVNQVKHDSYLSMQQINCNAY